MHFAISTSPRRIAQALYEHLSEQKTLFSYELPIKGDKRKNRSKRVAKLEVRSVRVQLICPNNLKKVASSNVEVDVVWVREISSSVPEGETPIDWKLVTTHQVHANQKLIAQLIEMYVSRWKIEEFFYHKNWSIRFRTCSIGNRLWSAQIRYNDYGKCSKNNAIEASKRW